MSQSNNNFTFAFACICAFIALIFGIIWVYYIALFVALPAGIIAFLLYMKLKADGKKRNLAILITLILAASLSIAALIPWYIGNYSIDR